MSNFDNIPQELKRLKQWVCWDGTKIPKNAKTGGNAMSNNPSTWSDYETAVNAVSKYGFGGIGFMFDNNYFGVDLDKCLDNMDFVDEFVETLQSYTEISRSGTGIHIICKGKLPEGNRRRGKVEMYIEGRYFIMTGNLYNEKYKEIKECSETIKPLHAKYLADHLPKVAPKKFEVIDLADSEIIDKARNCKTGNVFQLLYSGNWEGLPGMDSQSNADYSLCRMLAFWTQRNYAQIDRIFRSSGLYRTKWDSKRGSTTYGAMTIEKAIANCVEVYEPNQTNKESDIAIQIFGDGTQKVLIPKTQYDMNDTGNSLRLRDKFLGNIKYSYVNKCWYYWTGQVWTTDITGEIKKLADVVVEDIKKEAFDETEEDAQKQKLAWANKSGSSKSKEAMIKELQHLDGIPILPNEMDSYTDYLNCQNGVINLRSGELMPHDSNLLLSNISYCEYTPDNEKPKLWLEFLNDVCKGDQELIEYLQKCIGYSLSGSVKEQCLFFLYGMGNNGKSTFLDIVSDLLGTYASNTQPETLMLRNQQNTGANSDIARLKGARFVTSEEPTEGVRLNEGLVKQLTGGGKITARFLYGSEFEYAPEFKIWIATNHKPTIRGTDLGIWRRIRLIPFEYTVPKEKLDKSLRWKLRKELPQILHWAVEGCLKWQREGLDQPTCVKQATEEYKSEMDLLQSFIDECVEIDYSVDTSVNATKLYQVYCAWCKERNDFTYSNRKFGLEMTKKLPEKIRTGNGYEYRKIKINSNGLELIKSPSNKNYNIGDFS